LESPVKTNVPESVPWREIPSFRLIDSPLKRVRDLVFRSLSGLSLPGEVAPLLAHVVARTGKMIRPGLVLLSGRCFGQTTDKHIETSAVVEMIHNATLLHDDVIDEGQTRRGAPTVNRMWGNESAVLLGDFVLSQVFRMVANLDPPAARVIGDTAVRVCEGELRQVAQKRNWQLTEAEYISIITEKSAAFFSGCCRLGALLSEAQEVRVEALARYGLYAGIAFQIADDLLDVAGDEGRTGKTAQSDLNRSKLTLAAIHLIDAVGPSARNDVYAMLDSPTQSEGDLRRMLVRHGSLQYAHGRALDYVRSATEALEILPPGDAKDALIETARFVAERTA
jgi:octaprenyl-diphosphate synthase